MMKLSSLERVRKAMTFEKSDVIPVGTYMGNHAARIAGIPLQSYYTDSQKMFEAQKRFFDNSRETSRFFGKLMKVKYLIG